MFVRVQVAVEGEGWMVRAIDDVFSFNFLRTRLLTEIREGSSRRMHGHHQLFISSEVANLHANASSIGENKRRKGPNWRSGVDKNRFSDFLKFEHTIRHTAF